MIKRRAMQVAFAVGVVLTLTIATLWVRGFFATDWLLLSRAHGTVRALVLLNGDKQGIRCVLGRIEASTALAPDGTNSPLLQPAPLSASWGFRHFSQDPFGGAFLRSAEYGKWSQRLRFNIAMSGVKVAPPDIARGVTLAAPWWFLLAVGAVTTGMTYRALWGRPAQRRRRRAAGLCESCAYDLRSAAHERCPECGEVVAPAARV